MRPGISGIDYVDLMSTLATLEPPLKHSRVIVLKASGPTEGISDDQNSESARRLFERIVAVIKTKLICHRAVIAFAKDTRAGAKVGAHAKTQIRIKFIEALEEIGIENDHQKFYTNKNEDRRQDNLDQEFGRLFDLHLALGIPIAQSCCDPDYHKASLTARATYSICSRVSSG